MADDNRSGQAKRGKGRPAWSRNQVKVLTEKLTSSRMQALMEGAYPAEVWLAKFRKLSDETQFKLRSANEPRQKDDTTSVFNLHVHGLRAPCSKCGHREDESLSEKPEEAPPREAGLRLIDTAGSSSRMSWEGEQ